MDIAYSGRAEHGKLDCGLFDWGGFCINNMARKLWAAIAFSPSEMIREHTDTLIDVLMSEFKQSGGGDIDRETFRLCIVECHALCPPPLGTYTTQHTPKWKSQV